MTTEDTRLLLIDLENMVGTPGPRERPLRARVSALLAAAGPVHHAVAGYTTTETGQDAVASILAELGVAPLRTAPGPDAAELVLLAHARRVHDALGCRRFLVASADRRFAELAETGLGRLDVLAWEGQPVASKLAKAARQVRRIPKPTGTGTEQTEDEPRPVATEHPHREVHVRRNDRRVELTTAVLTATAAGAALAVSTRLTDALLGVLCRR
ncbi:MAG: hypothetical protein ACR2GH_19305 [Pseudonocardia sp.]